MEFAEVILQMPKTDRQIDWRNSFFFLQIYVTKREMKCRESLMEIVFLFFSLVRLYMWLLIDCYEMMTIYHDLSDGRYEDRDVKSRRIWLYTRMYR